MPRGKKECPECYTLVGPRLAVCECGHKFTFKSGKAPRVNEPLKLPPLEKPLENLTENPSEIVGVDDRDALKSFIDQLQSAYERADHTGGGYGAFLHHKHGCLQVEVCFPMR